MFSTFPLEAIEQSIGSRFESQVLEHERCLAVRTRHVSLMYGELNSEANRIGGLLRSVQSDDPAPIALLFEHGATQIAAVLGVLKTGNAYVALDPSYPPTRLAAVLESAGAEIVLCDRANLALTTGLAGSARAVVPVDAVVAGRPLVPNPDVDVGACATAYIFQTSGSTGSPKGVYDVHRNVLHNILRYTNTLQIGPCDRLTLLQSCSFSGSVSSLFGALLNGAAVFPFDVRLEGGTALAAWMVEQRITMYHSVPTIFRRVASGEVFFPDARVVRLEGDRATGADGDRFRRHFPPGCALVNGLGTTETGLVRQYRVDHVMPVADGILPVGYPVRDMEVIVVGDDGSALAEGAAGEVAVRSEYLASGYWRRPDLTASAFLADPAGTPNRTYRTGDRGRLRADGCLEYLGRMDSAPKVRGHHIEPAEVEDALLRLPEVLEAVVATVEHQSGECDVVAFVVWHDGAARSQIEVSRALADTLPAFMIPSRVVACDVLPLDANGKHARRALVESLEPASRTPGRDAPTDALEAEIARVFESVLGVDHVGADESFFDVGGDSLAAAEVCAQVGTSHGIELPPSALLAAPTARELAQVLRRPSARVVLEAVPLAAGGVGAPCFLVSGPEPAQLIELAGLARLVGGDRPVWGFSPFGADSIPEIAALVLARIRELQPTGPYRLGGWCFGAVVAFEIAHQLHAGGDDVEFLGLIGVSAFDFPRLVDPRAARRYRRYQGLGGVLPALRHHLARTRSLPPRARVGYAQWAAGRVIPFFRARLDTPFARGHTEPLERRAAVAAFEQYRAMRYDGRAVLFLSEAETATYSRDPVADWAGLATVTDVHVVRAAHADLLHGPGLKALAQLVTKALEQGARSRIADGDPAI